MRKDNISAAIGHEGSSIPCLQSVVSIREASEQSLDSYRHQLKGRKILASASA